jgi:hypothetical protein
MLASFHVPRISSLLRIFVESALLYTAGMFVMLVLRALSHPAQLIAHDCMIPTTGACPAHSNLGVITI